MMLFNRNFKETGKNFVGNFSKIVKMVCKRCYSHRFIGVVLLVCPCLVMISLHMTYAKGKSEVLSSQTPKPVLYPLGTSGSVATSSIITETRQPIRIKFAQYNTFSNSCNEMTFPSELMSENKWQNVDAVKSAFVFSAYLEGDEVKVTGAATRTGNYVCQLWYLSTNNSMIYMNDVTASVHRFPEHHRKKYIASHFKCRIYRGKATGVLLAVSVTKSKCQTPLNVVPVVQHHQSNFTNKFTICVAPFSNKYGRAYELVEWMEFNRILGADKFVFYNYSSASNIKPVLNSYSQKGLVEIVDWKLPMMVSRSKEEIHYFGHVASLNECLLRCRKRSEFIVNLDLDEFIIPREENVTSWEQMINKLTKYGIYIFANVFFRKEWSDSRTNFSGYVEASRYRLVTLLRLKHEKKIWLYKKRSKYIVRPNAVKVLGIHFVWQTSGTVLNVPHNVALMHHYRNWMKYNDKQDRIEDDIVVTKYKDALLKAVTDKWSTLPDVVFDIPMCKKPKDFSAC